jgi:hypothetical protein
VAGEAGLCEIVSAALAGSKLGTIHEQACAAIRNLAIDNAANQMALGDAVRRVACACPINPGHRVCI